MAENNFTVMNFGDICKIQTGFAFKSEDFSNDPKKGLPIVRMNNLKDGVLSLKDAVYVRAEIVRKLARYSLQPGDFLFGMSGSLDNFAIVREQDIPCYLNQRVGKLVPYKCNPTFARHLFRSSEITRGIYKFAAGNAQLNVSPRQIEAIPVLVPPPEEQAVIACMLDGADSILARTRAGIVHARTLRDSLIHQLLRTGLYGEQQKKSSVGFIPVSWNCKPLGQHIAEGPTNGIYRPESDYGSVGTPIVRIDSFDDGQIHGIAALRRVKVRAVIERRYALAKDDILINRVNSLSHIGKAAIVPTLDEPTIFESNIMSLRCDDQLVPDFLILVLCSDTARKHWSARAKPAVNQASINQRDVRELLVPLPHPDEQHKIARVVSASSAHLEKLTAVADAQLALKKSLMHDLFTGRVRVMPSHSREAILG